MVFSSLIFIFAFLPVVLFFYYGVLQKIQHRNLFLLFVSLFFYSWGEYQYFIIILLSVFVNFKAGLLIDEADQEGQEMLKKNILKGGIFFNLFFLFFFKYEGFFVETVVEMSEESTMESLGLPLPIGISFFTFQAISYLVDVYRKSAPVQKSAVSLGLYISFFPQLIAGPIVRYKTIAEQINERKTTHGNFNEGVRRFIIGLSKKIIFANQFSVIALASFHSPNPSVAFAWLGALAYTLQIYYDFSGYSDMAIGLGKMFGFDFLENFNYPYISRSVSEFWRRWHISLGSWFRDYVYIPLGGSKVSKPRLVLNLLAVWLLTGIWHGAAWNFVLWGMGYFLILTLEKLLSIEKWLKFYPFAAVYFVFTLVAVMCGWVMFAETTVEAGWEHLEIMMSFQDNPEMDVMDDALRYTRNYGIFLVAAVIFATPIIPNFCKFLHNSFLKMSGKQQITYLYVQKYVSSVYYLALFLISVSYLVIDSHNPFIYFNF